MGVTCMLVEVITIHLICHRNILHLNPLPTNLYVCSMLYLTPTKTTGEREHSSRWERRNNTTRETADKNHHRILK